MNEERGMIISTRGWQQAKTITKASEMLTERRSQLTELAGDPKVAERLVTISLHSLAEPRMAEKLQACDLYTLIIAVREAAAMDLMPNGIAGEGWLVPYWNKEKSLYDIQFQAGWRGLQKLLAETAEIATGIFYERDEYDYATGSQEFVRHKPALKDRGDRVGVWADAFLLRSGNHRVEIMTMAQIEQRRRASKMADHGAWVEWYDEMARKTVTRAIFPRIPQLPPKAQRLLEYEDRAEDRAALPPSEPRPALEPRAPSAADRARQLLGVVPGGGEASDDALPAATTIDVSPGADAATQESAPGNADAGDDAPPHGVEAAVGVNTDPRGSEERPATPGDTCSATDEADQACVREAGHRGHHRNAEKETWSA